MSYARRTIPHRCVRCEARRTLEQLWERYERPPKCRVCGYKRLYPCFDRMPGRYGRKMKCNCGGYWFPHRKGSKYCDHHPAHELHWTERHDGHETAHA